MAEDKPDDCALVDEAAKAIGLPIAPEYRANVMLNFERSLAIARPLLEVELDDELTRRRCSGHDRPPVEARDGERHRRAPS